jgi:hypothetical protein
MAQQCSTFTVPRQGSSSIRFEDIAADAPSTGTIEWGAAIVNVVESGGGGAVNYALRVLVEDNSTERTGSISAGDGTEETGTLSTGLTGSVTVTFELYDSDTGSLEDTAERNVTVPEGNASELVIDEFSGNVPSTDTVTATAVVVNNVVSGEGQPITEDFVAVADVGATGTFDFSSGPTTETLDPEEFMEFTFTFDQLADSAPSGVEEYQCEVCFGWGEAGLTTGQIISAANSPPAAVPYQESPQVIADNRRKTRD